MKTIFVDFDFLRHLLEIYEYFPGRKISRETLLKFYNHSAVLEGIVFSSLVKLVSDVEGNSEYIPKIEPDIFKKRIADQENKNWEESFRELLGRLENHEDADGRFYVKDVLKCL